MIIFTSCTLIAIRTKFTSDLTLMYSCSILDDVYAIQIFFTHMKFLFLLDSEKMRIRCFDTKRQNPIRPDGVFCTDSPTFPMNGSLPIPQEESACASERKQVSHHTSALYSDFQVFSSVVFDTVLSCRDSRNNPISRCFSGRDADASLLLFCFGQTIAVPDLCSAENSRLPIF